MAILFYYFITFLNLRNCNQYQILVQFKALYYFYFKCYPDYNKFCRAKSIKHVCN